MSAILSRIDEHLTAGHHVHIYGDAVATIAHEIFESDEDHLDVMPNNATVQNDYLVLDSNKGEIYIAEDDLLAIHAPTEP